MPHAPPSVDPIGDPIRTAFVELHAPRLHGFALLLTVGDRARAARLAADALEAGASRADELRHPERAAAWLRARVVRAARRMGRGPAYRSSARRGALAMLGVDTATHAALARLNVRERAALIAAIVERLDRRDVATIVDLDGSRLTRCLARSRRRYTTEHAAAPSPGGPRGPIAELVRTTAARAIT